MPTKTPASISAPWSSETLGIRQDQPGHGQPNTKRFFKPNFSGCLATRGCPEARFNIPLLLDLKFTEKRSATGLFHLHEVHSGR